MKRWVLTLLIVVFAGIFLVSAFYIGNYFWESAKQQGKYNDLANKVHSHLKDPSDPTRPTADGTDSTDPTGTEPYVNPLVQVENPETGELVWVLPEYAEIFQINPDLVGWLRIDDSKINYPVVQKPESADYYLYRNFYKEDSARGCLYAREICDIFTPSDNITIYGHCMKDNTMFGNLTYYKQKSYYQNHSIIYFDTLTEHHTYEIVSVFITTASIGQGFPYHNFVEAGSEAEFNTFVSRCKALAMYDTGVDAVYGDKLITLSTCEYSVENGRLVVVAKRID